MIVLQRDNKWFFLSQFLIQRVIGHDLQYEMDASLEIQAQIQSGKQSTPSLPGAYEPVQAQNHDGDDKQQLPP